MKRPLLGSILVLALAMSLGAAGARPAAAGEWYVGSGFRVGDIYFSLAFDHRHRHHDPYYYRTRHHVRHDGYRCGEYCLKRSGYTYHHAACPLVLHHFRSYGFYPARVWESYRGPRYDRHYDRHYNRHYDRRHDRGRHYGHRDYGRRGYGHRDYGYRSRHRDHHPRYCPYR